MKEAVSSATEKDYPHCCSRLGQVVGRIAPRNRDDSHEDLWMPSTDCHGIAGAQRIARRYDPMIVHCVPGLGPFDNLLGQLVGLLQILPVKIAAPVAIRGLRDDDDGPGAGSDRQPRGCCSRRSPSKTVKVNHERQALAGLYS